MARRAQCAHATALGPVFAWEGTPAVALNVLDANGVYSLLGASRRYGS